MGGLLALFIIGYILMRTKGRWGQLLATMSIFAILWYVLVVVFWVTVGIFALGLFISLLSS